MHCLPLSFYQREDVVQIARDLIGKALFTYIDGQMTGGIISETEAYRGPEDKASHAYNNRRTERTQVMFQNGGISYVYTCYGIHQLLNVITNVENIPHAVLIRAFFPTHGLETITKRRKKSANDPTLAKGPGSVTQALGVTKRHNGLFLDRDPLWIEETSLSFPKNLIKAGPRIGIAYAKEHALLPWRFFLPHLPRHSITKLLQFREKHDTNKDIHSLSSIS